MLIDWFTPSVVIIFYNFIPPIIKNTHDIALNIMQINIDYTIKIHS